MYLAFHNATMSDLLYDGKRDKASAVPPAGGALADWQKKPSTNPGKDNQN
jgi:hypothetical protein